MLYFSCQSLFSCQFIFPFNRLEEGHKEEVGITGDMSSNKIFIRLLLISNRFKPKNFDYEKIKTLLVGRPDDGVGMRMGGLCPGKGAECF